MKMHVTHQALSGPHVKLDRRQKCSRHICPTGVKTGVIGNNCCGGRPTELKFQTFSKKKDQSDAAEPHPDPIDSTHAVLVLR